MNTKKVTLILCFLAVLLPVALALVPYVLDARIGYQRVLGFDLPDGIKCEYQRYNSQGFDRYEYDYRAVFAGKCEQLKQMIDQLGLVEVDGVEGPGGWHTTKSKWWNAPSSCGRPFRFYCRGSSTYCPTNGIGGPITFVELDSVSSKMFLLQIDRFTKAKGTPSKE